MQPIAPILCASLPATICIAAHYFPWRFWFKSGRLPRLLAYVLGLCSILLPATIAAWFAATTVAETLGLLWLAAASAGVGTLLAWWYDWHNRVELQHKDELDRIYGE
jgi:hypothetical protein